MLYRDYFVYAFKTTVQTIFQLEMHKSILFIANIKNFNRRFPTKFSTLDKKKKVYGIEFSDSYTQGK